MTKGSSQQQPSAFAAFDSPSSGKTPVDSWPRQSSASDAAAVKRRLSFSSQISADSNQDSTTMASPTRTSSRNHGAALYKPGDFVIIRWTDGRFYQATVERLDSSVQNNSAGSTSSPSKMSPGKSNVGQPPTLNRSLSGTAVNHLTEVYLCRFDDGSFDSIHIRDMKSLDWQHNFCVVCYGDSSVSVDCLVVCRQCRMPYHRDCHAPPVLGRFNPKTWVCRDCVFFEASQPNPLAEILRLENTYKRDLPYNLYTLKWNPSHTTNMQNRFVMGWKQGVGGGSHRNRFHYHSKTNRRDRGEREDQSEEN